MYGQRKILQKNVDAALINIGGIRTTIGKGDILLKSVFEVMPFENEVIIVKMKGAIYRDFLIIMQNIR
jgi:2',3'-cyclic-nucleotide 2'-phosphodiesterase (5'-nucleotidase family)